MNLIATLLGLSALTSPVASEPLLDLNIHDLKHLAPLSQSESYRLGLNPADDGLLLRNTALGSDTRSEDQAALKGSPFRLLALSPSEFRGSHSNIEMQTIDEGRFCAATATQPFADIAVYLPDAATISSIRVFGFDSNVNNDMTMALVRRCTPANFFGNVTTTVISEIIPATSAGNFTQFQSIGANNVVDNAACAYTMRVRFSSPGNPNPCVGTTLRVHKIRLSYTL